MLLTRLRRIWLLMAVVLPSLGHAQRETSQEALARLDETFAIRIKDEGLAIKDLLPAIVVSVSPAFEETKQWYPTAALTSLIGIFGTTGLRSCEACMGPRLFVEQHRVEQSTANLTTAEIIRLDESTRGTSAAAITAIWLDENEQGVALRVIDLRNSRIIIAENFGPAMLEPNRTADNLKLARELERRTRGDAIVHTFIDIGVFPMQHVSLDWSEQWGDTNANLSGFSLSLFDPVVGLGGSYFRVIPQALNLMVGAKVLFSVPSTLIAAISRGEQNQLLDPILTGVLMVRFPIAKSNFGIVASVSTNGRFTVGISLMNFTLLPILP